MNAINSINHATSSIRAVKNQNNIAFKGIHEGDLSVYDMENAVKILHSIEDQFDVKEKKSKLGVAVSIAAGAAVLFGIGKTTYSKAEKMASSFLNTSLVQKGAKNVGNFVNSFDGKLANSIKDAASKTGKYLGNTKNIINDKLISKLGGSSNVAGIATAAVGSAFVATTDSNNDGVADIAQKGVNAYKAALQRAGVVGELIEALT